MPSKLMPWEQLPFVWKTEAEYFQWLRGQMRKAWSRHPIKIEFMKANRVKAPIGKQIDKLTGKPKEIWAQTCVQCEQQHPQSNTEVDHIVRAGSFRNWEECEAWLMALMQINFAELQILCKPCHKIKSYAETHGLSFDDAAAQKAGIAWLKNNTPIQQKEYLCSVGYTGCPELNSLKSRRAAYVAHVKAKWSK